MAAEVAEALGAPLGVMVARKVGAPHQPELAIGAVAADGSYYLDERLASLTGARAGYVARERAAQMEEARKGEAEFEGRRRLSLAGRTVIIVDDGIATGATAIAAVRSAKAQGAARTVVAAPVGAASTTAALRLEADEVICPYELEDLEAVGNHYRDFRPVAAESVKEILARWPGRVG